MVTETPVAELEKKETLQDMSQSKLDYWLMKNIQIMEKLSVEESSSWFESDTPG